MHTPTPLPEDQARLASLEPLIEKSHAPDGRKGIAPVQRTAPRFPYDKDKTGWCDCSCGDLPAEASANASTLMAGHG